MAAQAGKEGPRRPARRYLGSRAPMRLRGAGGFSGASGLLRRIWGVGTALPETRRLWNSGNWGAGGRGPEGPEGGAASRELEVPGRKGCGLCQRPAFLPDLAPANPQIKTFVRKPRGLGSCEVQRLRESQGSGQLRGDGKLPRVLGFLWKMEESMTSPGDPRLLGGVLGLFAGNRVQIPWGLKARTGIKRDRSILPGEGRAPGVLGSPLACPRQEMWPNTSWMEETSKDEGWVQG